MLQEILEGVLAKYLCANGMQCCHHCWDAECCDNMNPAVHYDYSMVPVGAMRTTYWVH